MKKFFLASAILLCGILFAEYSIDLSEGYKLRLGGDERARWEFFDRTVPSPNGNPQGNYPANQYLRLRTRVWAAIDIENELTFNVRLANRTHFVSSSPSDPNNQGTSTWKFPDETYVDALNAVYKPNDAFTITLGRQFLTFGNGMIFSDPTPFDQGRSAYTDGLSAQYKDEQNTLTLFVTYDTWKDHNVFLNDQNRILRSGDVFTSGIYWTYTYTDALKWDAYYIFNDVEDRNPNTAERNHPADCSTSLHTYGIRIFGQPIELIDYSAELAAQGGRNADGYANQGKMADARLNVHIPYMTEMKPVFGLEYTHFSGDKAGTKNSEGWNPLLAQSPLWGEELLPIMFNGNWTNLNLFRASLNAEPINNLKAGIAVTDCYVDEPNNGSGPHHLGLLLSANINYKYNEHLAFAFQLSRFNASECFNNGHDSIWGRFETTITF